MNPHSRWQAHYEVYGGICLILQGKRHEKRASSHLDDTKNRTRYLDSGVRSTTHGNEDYAKGSKQRGEQEEENHRWGGRWGSNPRPPEPQSGALPLSYIHHDDLLLHVQVWGGRWGSNPRPPEPQSGALPLSYIHHDLIRTGILPTSTLFLASNLAFGFEPGAPSRT